MSPKISFNILQNFYCRPPRKSRQAANEIPKKDLYFDYRSLSPANKLKTSTSYSELARTSMMNSSYLRLKRLSNCFKTKIFT